MILEGFATRRAWDHNYIPVILNYTPFEREKQQLICYSCTDRTSGHITSINSWLPTKKRQPPIELK